MLPDPPDHRKEETIALLPLPAAQRFFLAVIPTGRCDVVRAWYPFASGQGSKQRPCLVVQNDADNQRLANTDIAQITSNLRRVGDKSHVLIEVGTPEGAQSGLLHDSLISCNNLATIEQSRWIE
jgi:mRNA interferase MazF